MTKRFSADDFAELEGEATPFAADPRLVRRRSAAGDQRVARSGVRQAVRDTLLAAGYEIELAEKMAEETANQLDAIQSKVQSAA